LQLLNLREQADSIIYATASHTNIHLNITFMLKMNFKNMIFVIVALLSLSSISSAFWRLPCYSRSGLARLDPIVSPGGIASHVHAIHGGSNFGPSTTAEDLLASDCTSCGVKEDKSAYWTPALYFMYHNGTTVLVNQIGGMLAYYLLYTDGTPGQTITAFPNGFRMLAGDTNRRNFTCLIPEPEKSLWSGNELTEPALRQKALGFNCLNYVNPTKTEGSLFRHYLPSKTFMDDNCLSGLRLELMFPSCWNGRDLDSADHKSHMAYPSLVMTGSCPAGYPVRLPSLFYETIWDTTRYKGLEGTFVISNGDTSGFGYHGDFIAAWEVGVLQRAVDTCTNLSGLLEDCPVFSAVDTSCAFAVPSSVRAAVDDVFGAPSGLPGGVPVVSGPGPASMSVVASAPAASPDVTVVVTSTTIVAVLGACQASTRGLHGRHAHPFGHGGRH